MNSKKYIFITLFFGLIPTLFVLFINVTYDPMWFFNGNIWGQRSYHFANGHDEKERLFIKNNLKKKYHCLLLGSSRFLTIRTDQIPYESCFNFSVSSGNFYDMQNIAQFVLQSGNDIKKVIIGLDDWYFTSDQDQTCIEQSSIIKPIENKKIDHFLSKYISVKNLYYDWRIQNEYQVWIGYDKNFLPVMNPLAYKRRKLRESILDGKNLILGKKHNDTKLVYSPTCQNQLDKLLGLLPNAEKIGIHNPVITSNFVRKLFQNQLQSYSKVIYQMAQKFDKFYDPMIDLDYTEKDDFSWDGSHFFPEFWTMYFNKPDKIDVTKISYEEYEKQLDIKLKPYLKKISSLAKNHE